jgi:hypothetical protein
MANSTLNITKPGLSEVLFASIADPRGSMQRLLGQRERPPHVVITLLLFISTLIVPALLQSSYRGGTTLDSDFAGSIAMTFVLTLILSSFFATFSSHAFGAKDRCLRATAALIYSTAPITVMFTILLIASRLSMGDFTVINYLSSGVRPPEDFVIQIFPYVFKASICLALMTLAFGLSTLTHASAPVGFIMAAITTLLIMGSFILSLMITALVYPSTSSQTIEFFKRYFITTGA